MDDAGILDLYWARSESAIDETAAKYGSYCRTIALNILRSEEDADECVNDTYLKAWNAIPPARPKILSSYLGKITRNLSLNQYKEKRTQKHGGGEIALLLDELENCIPSARSIEAELEANEIAELLNQFLRAAKPTERAIFVRRYWYADSIAAIASAFHMGESKVKSLLFRMRHKLKLHLEKEGFSL